MTATLAGPMRLSIDAWDPAYGASGEADTEPDGAAPPIHLDVETPEQHWRPIDPDPGIQRPEAVLFVDGVRRIDARAWVDTQPDAGGPARSAVQGLCASYAAGVICCRTKHAHLLTADVRRGLFTTTMHATDLHTHAGTYRLNVTPPRSGIPHIQVLNLAVQRSLADVEIDVAAAARATLPDHGVTTGDDLLVVDGSLRRGRQRLPRAIGLVKTHDRTYLPEHLNRLISTLTAGQRTPAFRMGSSWERHSWYLRLPCGPGAPWAGIVRIECAANLDTADVITLANLSQAAIPRYASAEHKDPRAPQNLHPIAGLERDLHHRIGNRQLLYRALRRAARTNTTKP